MLVKNICLASIGLWITWMDPTIRRGKEINIFQLSKSCNPSPPGDSTAHLQLC